MHMIIVVGDSTETDNPLMHDVCVDLFPFPPAGTSSGRAFIRGYRIFYTRSFDISRVGRGYPIMATVHPLRAAIGIK